MPGKSILKLAKWPCLFAKCGKLQKIIYKLAKFADFVCILNVVKMAGSAKVFPRVIQIFANNVQILQAYVFLILQYLATKLGHFSDFGSFCSFARMKI